MTEHPDRARQAADAALGVLVKPFDSDAVVRALEVASLLMAGRAPGDLPGGLELFAQDAAIEMSR